MPLHLLLLTGLSLAASELVPNGGPGSRAVSDGELLLASDDECDADPADTGVCTLNALQHLARAKSAGIRDEAPSPDASPNSEKAFSSGGLQELNGRLHENPISAFNDQLDTSKAMGSGVYYQFQTSRGEMVWEGQVEGRPGDTANADTAFPLASASKLFTGFAAMVSMEMEPKDWHPQRRLNEFKGWEAFKNFPVHGSARPANLTLHHLLTHTSGLPFALRMSKEDILEQILFYRPGTAFGYTLGHRIIGWLLRDYWQERVPQIKSVEDAFRFLYWKDLGLSPATRFSEEMHHGFGQEGEAGDASIVSTGSDLVKLAVVALRKGELPNGGRLISERNWKKWAVPNLLPRKKLSKDLVAWQGAAGSWINWNLGGIKEQIMKQSGDYGWNYFGATYNNSKEIGWCGFFSSCLRITYQEDLAFVMMQRDVSDLKHSKPFLLQYFGQMAHFLQCPGVRLPIYCRFFKNMDSCISRKTVFCNVHGSTSAWTSLCPINTVRRKLLADGPRLDPQLHTCYVPNFR